MVVVSLEDAGFRIQDAGCRMPGFVFGKVDAVRSLPEIDSTCPWGRVAQQQWKDLRLGGWAIHPHSFFVFSSPVRFFSFCRAGALPFGSDR